MTQAQNQILFYAFRYCLGRMTYAAGDFCEYATENIRKIGYHELRLMVNEITKADEEDTERGYVGGLYSRLGMECDRREWLMLREVIRAELKRRDEEEKK